MAKAETEITHVVKRRLDNLVVYFDTHIFLLKIQRPIIELDFSECKINAAGIQTLVTALQTSSELTTLSLRGNPLTSDGVHHITRLLSTHPTLTSLDLSWCNLADQEIFELATTLQHHKTSSLSTLFFDHKESENEFRVDNRIVDNVIGTESLACFQELLFLNRILINLELPRKRDPKIIDADLMLVLASCFQENIDEIQRLCKVNQTIQLNWGKVAFAISFFRANQHNALKYTFLPIQTLLFSYIGLKASHTYNSSKDQMTTSPSTSRCVIL